MTTIRSAFSIVDRRWAITKVVRFVCNISNAACIYFSDSVSKEEVASSRIKIGASFNNGNGFQAGHVLMFLVMKVTVRTLSKNVIVLPQLIPLHSEVVIPKVLHIILCLVYCI